MRERERIGRMTAMENIHQGRAKSFDFLSDVEMETARESALQKMADEIEESFWHDVNVPDLDTSREAVRRAIEYTLRTNGES